MFKETEQCLGNLLCVINTNRQELIFVMWTVIQIMQQEDDAKYIADKLNSSGVISRIKQANKTVGETSYEVLVPAAEVQQALSIIIESEF